MTDPQIPRLIDGYDAALFDLDGVIYLGPLAVPGAAETMAELAAANKAVMYVTNNAARAAETVVRQLQGLGFVAGLDNVLTSAQVAAGGLADVLPPGAKVLVAGSASLAGLIAEAGLSPVASADDEPVAVLQGYDPVLGWPMLDEVCLAIARGAVWYATNDDASRPTERGLVPGAGAQIAAVAKAIGGSPTTFGKPHRPMMAEAVRRTGAERPLFVGDRIDTDIVGANNAGLDSLMVFSGAHGKRELLACGRGERPTHIGADVSALLQPRRSAAVAGETAACHGQRVTQDDSRIVLTTAARSRDEQFDALWAIAALAWAAPYLDATDALGSLDLIN
ncbi:MAG: HAD-IIA family hydrolase [Propionibacteriaceae bacterium]|nr:HAD-IIA family hydrolase [Propionibacteriaceae bacterium]